MPVILGLDTAWTATEPSGVALLEGNGDHWRCLASAPSYESFFTVADGKPIDWAQPRFRGSAPDMQRLLEVSRALAEAPVDLVAVDMPVATCELSCRRSADNAISTAFGGRGCSAHSPTPFRPGAIGALLTRELVDAGYRLVTGSDGGPPTKAFIEVYPHPALLALLEASYRVRYKVQKSTRYWPGLSVRERIARLLGEFRCIDTALRQQIREIPVFLPASEGVPSLSALKRYEDTLDALVCGWVAVQFMRGRARAYGDETATIWVPDPEQTGRLFRTETTTP